MLFAFIGVLIVLINHDLNAKSSNLHFVIKAEAERQKPCPLPNDHLALAPLFLWPFLVCFCILYTIHEVFCCNLVSDSIFFLCSTICNPFFSNSSHLCSAFLRQPRT